MLRFMGLTDGETGSCSDGWAMLSKSLIQFSVDGQGYFLPVVGPETKDGGGHGPPSKGPVQALLRSVPQLCSRPPRPTSPLETPGHSQPSLGQFLVGSWLRFPRSWCPQGLACVLQESVSSVLYKFCKQIPLACKVKFPEVLSSFARSPGWEFCCES